VKLCFVCEYVCGLGSEGKLLREEVEEHLKKCSNQVCGDVNEAQCVGVLTFVMCVVR